MHPRNIFICLFNNLADKLLNHLCFGFFSAPAIKSSSLVGEEALFMHFFYLPNCCIKNDSKYMKYCAFYELLVNDAK